MVVHRVPDVSVGDRTVETQEPAPCLPTPEKKTYGDDIEKDPGADLVDGPSWPGWPHSSRPRPRSPPPPSVPTPTRRPPHRTATCGTTCRSAVVLLSSVSSSTSPNPP